MGKCSAGNTPRSTEVEGRSQNITEIRSVCWLPGDIDVWFTCPPDLGPAREEAIQTTVGDTGFSRLSEVTLKKERIRPVDQSVGGDKLQKQWERVKRGVPLDCVRTSHRRRWHRSRIRRYESLHPSLDSVALDRPNNNAPSVSGWLTRSNVRITNVGRESAPSGVLD